MQVGGHRIPYAKACTGYEAIGRNCKLHLNLICLISLRLLSALGDLDEIHPSVASPGPSLVRAPTASNKNRGEPVSHLSLGVPIAQCLAHANARTHPL